MSQSCLNEWIRNEKIEKRQIKEQIEHYHFSYQSTLRSIQAIDSYDFINSKFFTQRLDDLMKKANEYHKLLKENKRQLNACNESLKYFYRKKEQMEEEQSKIEQELYIMYEDGLISKEDMIKARQNPELFIQDNQAYHNMKMNKLNEKIKQSRSYGELEEEIINLGEQLEHAKTQEEKDKINDKIEQLAKEQDDLVMMRTYAESGCPYYLI